MTKTIAPRLEKAVKSSLERETDTDWFPDPWGWSDLHEGGMTRGDGLPGTSARETSPPDDPLEFATVPFLGGRKRRVPVLGHSIRLRMMTATLKVMQQRDAALLPGVLAYRLLPDGTFEHYRQANTRRNEMEEGFSSTRRVVVSSDIRSFFPSLTARGLMQVVGDVSGWPELSQLLEWFESELGYALPEGHSASRSLANAVLMPADRAIQQPFTRWVDDYHIFCHDFREGHEVVEQVGNSLKELGFSTAPAKTRIQAWEDFTLAGSNLSAARAEGRPDFQFPLEALADSSIDLTETHLERRLRYSLRLAAEDRSDTIIDALSMIDPVRLPVSVLPRLAWALSCRDWSPSTIRLFDNLVSLNDEFTTWRRARLLAALWYAPTNVVRERLPALIKNAGHSQYCDLVLLRVLARHDPASLTQVTGFSRGSSWCRAARLVQREIEGEAALAEGPPMRTYL